MNIKEVKGYKPDVYDERDNVYGAGTTPDPIINQSGNWKPFLVPDEFQNKNGFDPFACVTFTILNAIEKLAKCQYNEDWNLSERFTYIVSESIPTEGNSPREVAKAIRKFGVLAEKDLSYDELIDTLEKFNSPKPMDKKLLKEALKFLDDYIFRFDFLPLKGIQDVRGDNEVFRDALKRSPIGIAVYAWAERNGKYFRPAPSPETHFTLLVNIDGEEKEVFDSYAPGLKRLDKDFYVATAMRFYLRKKTEEEKRAELKSSLNLLQVALNWLASLIPLINKKKEEIIVKENPPVIDSVPIEEVKPEPINRIELLAKAIKRHENVHPSLNNPGGLRESPFQSGFIIQKATGKPLATFSTYEKGWKALIHQITIVCNGTSPAYTRVAKNLGLNSCADLTIEQFIKTYAPSNENNTKAYILIVTQETKLPKETRMGDLL